MTKQEHLELNKWQREILAGLKAAQACPDSAGARVLIVEAAKNLQFLSENLDGGIIRLDSDEMVNTGQYLKDLSVLLVRDEPAEHLPKVITWLEAMLASHDKYMAKMPDPN